MSDEGVQNIIDESDDKTYKKPVGTVFPTFFVGIGGCGSGIVQNIRKFVTSRPDYEQRYKKLVHFMAFDTDQDDLKDLDFTGFLISDFPKGEYVNIKMGKEYKEADPFFQQWWPDWYASRPDSTKGAGQIRVESRLSLYYQLDQDRSQIISEINDKILQSKDHDNPFRSVRPPAAYVHIFCSLAGGTGSGGLMTIGYLFRELLKSARLSPVIVANAVLPTLFYRKVRPRLHDDIRSNGYAALKELEWFQTLGYNNNPRMERGDIKAADQDTIELNYNPNSRPESGNQKVISAPFDLINLIDQPGDFSFKDPKDIYPAIAGAAYAQLFSPIMGQRESEEDNYYKKIKHLDGGFSQNWGTFGLSMLVLPDQPILEYCANKLASALVDGVKMGDDLEKAYAQIQKSAKKEIEANQDTPEKLRDAKYVSILRDAGLLKHTVGENQAAITTLNAAFKGETNSNWEEGCLQRLEAGKRALEDTSGFVKENDFIGEGMPQMRNKFDPKNPPSGQEDEFIRDRETEFKSHVSTSWGRFTQAVAALLKDGSKSDSGGAAKSVKDVVDSINAPFPGGKEPQALAKTLALYMMRQLHLKKEDLPSEPDVTLPRKLKDEIKEKAPKSFIENFGKDDWVDVGKTVTSTLRNALDEISEPDEYARISISNHLLEEVTAQLGASNALSLLSDDLKKRFDKAADDLLTNEEGMTGEFILDAEVLKGLRSNNRYWERLWWDLVDEDTKGVTGCDAADGTIKARIESVLSMKEVVDEAFKELDEEHSQANKAKGGRDNKVPRTVKVKRAAEEIIRFCKKQLVPIILGERQAGDDRERKGILIDKCLWLEAKWELEELFIQDHFVNYEQGAGGLLSNEEKRKMRHKLAAEFEPKRDEMEQYISEKMAFVCEKSRVLSRLRLTESSAVDPFIFVALSSHYQKGLDLKIGEQSNTALSPLSDIIKKSHQIAKGARYLDGWVDEKRIAIYQGQAGLPVHNFWPVNGEMLESYERIYRDYVSGYDKNAKPKKDFPSHIDKNFEDPDEWDPHAVLPSLKPSRSVTSGSTSDRGFFELIAHDLVRPIAIGAVEKSTEGEVKLPKGDQYDQLVRKTVRSSATKLNTKVALSTESENQTLGYLRLRQSIKDAVIAERLDIDKLLKEGGTLWVLDAAHSPGRESNVSPILQSRRQDFVVVLGDRLDRAFDAYRRDFRKGNRKLVGQVDELLDTKLAKLAKQENPRDFRTKLEGVNSQLVDMLDKEHLRKEQGFRVDAYIRFLEGAIGHVKAIYVAFEPEAPGS